MSASETTAYYFLLPHPDGSRLLIRVDENAFALPSVEVSRDSDLLDVSLMNRAVAAQFGVNVTTLHSMHCYHKPGRPIVVFALENHDPHWVPPSAYRWLDRNTLETGRFTCDLQQQQAQVWFAQWEVGSKALLPWWSEGWIGQAHAWIAERLDALGLSLTAPIEQRKSWYFSSVMRVPTDSGDLYFKAVPSYMPQENALAGALPTWIPGQTLEVVALDTARSWMLSKDMSGENLEQLRTVEDWGGALADYGRFQQRTADHLDELLRLGCPDLRLNALPDKVVTLATALPALTEGLGEAITPAECMQLSEIEPQIRGLCDAASRFNLPATLVHGDFHGINVVRAWGKTLFFDWSDACVCHPFFDAMELLDADDWLPAVDDAYARLRDTYLQQWTACAPLPDLQELWRLLEPLWAFAMAWRHVRVLKGMERIIPLRAPASLLRSLGNPPATVLPDHAGTPSARIARSL